ncbi:hypothetical protein MGN70_007242 [Eutypa lata]|nr:hypothetical protein MGN70_007242 [Eutypa lata]
MPLKVFGNIFWNSQPPEAASKEPQQAKRESGLFLPDTFRQRAKHVLSPRGLAISNPGISRHMRDPAILLITELQRQDRQRHYIRCPPPLQLRLISYQIKSKLLKLQAIQTPYRTVDIISRVKASTQQTAHNEPHDVPPPTTAANTTMADVESAQRIDHWVRGQQQSPPPPPGPITSSREFIRAILAGHPGSAWGWAAHALVRVPQATLSFGVTWLLAAARIAFPHRAWPGALTAVWVLGYASAGWAAGAWVAFQVVHAGRGHGAWRRKWGRWFVLVDGAACALWLGGIVLTALVVGRPDVDTYSAFFEENRLRDEDDAGGKKGDNSGDGTGGWTKSEEKIARSIFAVVFYFHIALFVLYFICTLYNLGARTWWYQKLCRCLNPKKHDDDDDDVGKARKVQISEPRRMPESEPQSRSQPISRPVRSYSRPIDSNDGNERQHIQQF